jgi:cold shock CspA family protein
MNFKDRWETKANGETFLFTVEMQRALYAADLPVEPASLAALSTTAAAAPRTEQRSSQSRNESRPPKQESKPKPQDDPEPDIIQFDPVTGKYIGRMKFYLAAKGYGFIARGAGESIFFHKSKAKVDPEQLDKGAWLLYDVSQTARGEEAVEVEPFTGTPPE